MMFGSVMAHAFEVAHHVLNLELHCCCISPAINSPCMHMPAFAVHAFAAASTVTLQTVLC